MLGQKSNLEKVLMGKNELKEEIIKEFTASLLKEVEDKVKKQGKEEVLRLINQ